MPLRSSGDGPLPATDRGRYKRDSLLAAATQCFGESGFAKTSVAGICRAAGVSQGGFYVWFASKDAVFTEVVRDISRQIREVGHQARKGSSTRVEAEIAGSRAFFTWLTQNRYLHRILHQIDEVNPALAEEFFRSVSQPYSTGLASSLTAEWAEGENPELLAYALMGINHFVSMRWILWTRSEFPEHLLEQYSVLIESLFLGIASFEAVTTDPGEA